MTACGQSREPAPRHFVASADAGGLNAGVAFVLSGHGCQWRGMAVDLLEASPLFAERLRACQHALEPHVGWSLLDVLRERPRARRLQRVDVVQPALFAVSVALAELLRECGVRPDALVGHSQGEVAAVHLAGGLSLQDAAAVIARRARLLVRLSGKGTMLAVALDHERLEAELIDLAGALDVGAINGPASLAVSGERDAIERLLSRCRKSGVRAGKVAIDYAAHSRQIEALREEMIQALSSLSPCRARTPIYSTATGQLLDTAECAAEHWYRAERETVRMQQTVRAMLEDGLRRFVEIGAHPILTPAIQETVDDALGEGHDALVVGSLRRGQNAPDRLLAALSDLAVHGLAVDLKAASRLLGSQASSSVSLAGRGGATPPPGPPASGRAPHARDASSFAGLRSMSAPARRQAAREAVLAEVAGVAGEALGPEMAERAFKDAGLDSSGLVELRNRLCVLTGRPISATLMFDCPTPAALAERLLAEMTGAPAASRLAVAGAPVAHAETAEPIAIVGMSCRFPGGVGSPAELWELLAAGRDAVGPFPTDRGWDLERLYDPDPDRSGTTYAREGGFVHDAGEFDAEFFAISPREAAAMDPQQRQFLEACWEAVEAAGLDVRALAGTQTAVYAGINRLDYSSRYWLTPDGLEGHNMTGGSGSVIAGRVSYALGLHGPALTVDTACSSSLVTLHLACSALRRRECSLALAGGVSVMVTPGLFPAFSRQRALARDGRCKAFSDSADGTGWGEGVGVLCLERLADARRNGHPVVALIRASAVNQDGASNGLAAPNGLAQQQVINQALASAGLSPSDVDAVEAHGTGTRLGDPIEAQALLAVYGQGRPPGRPLWLGSIKSNIGHTQAAAGVAGVIKMALALRHELLPQTLHVQGPCGDVDWSRGEVSLLTDAVAWPDGERPRRAGVSSYGISGTNAHVIVEQAPRADRAGAPARRALPSGRVVSWVLSARGEPALAEQAARLHRRLLDAPDTAPQDVALTLAGKPAFERRAVLSAATGEQLRDGLSRLARGEAAAGLVRGTAREGGSTLAFMFTGQGAQRVGMGAGLYESLPAFATAFDEVCAEMDPQLGCSLREIVFVGGGSSAREGSPAEGRLDGTMHTQAGLFALEVALHRLLGSWGVRPDYVIGHSIGELVAAFVAGVWSLPDACRLVLARGRLMEALPRSGAMVAVHASEREVGETIADLADRVSIAGINAPGSVVISGEEQAVMGVAAAWAERGRKTKRLRVSHAFHSPLMDAMLDEFRRVAEAASYAPPAIPVVSNLRGETLSAELCEPEYWVRHVREPVRFAEGVAHLRAQRVESFLELGPDGVLSAMVGDAAGGANAPDDDGAVPLSVPLLRAERDELEQLHSALAHAWVGGAQVDWRAALHGLDARAVELPTYAFQRRRYWVDRPEGCWLVEDGGAKPVGWRYRVRWKPASAGAHAPLAGRWLLVFPEGLAEEPPVAETMRELAAAGAEPIAVTLDLAAADRHLARERLSAALASADGGSADGADRVATPVAGVLSMLAFAGGQERDCDPSLDGVLGTLALVHGLDDAGIAAPLWIVTRGAVSVADSDRLEHPLQGALWGLGRVLRVESPDRWGGLIDLPYEPRVPVAERLCEALSSHNGEDELALRASGTLVRRLTRAGAGEDAPVPAWAPEGAVLVTGGLGALGGHLARRLAREGARRIVLAGRRGSEAPGALELERELSELGAQASVVACDVGERDRLRELLAQIAEQGPLSAVFHVAGVLDDGLIGELTGDRMRAVLRPKVSAAWHLHELTAELELEAFVMFSSISATLGAGGQAAYAAGNAYLDALAEHRHGLGLPATAVAWGAWSGGGMASAVESQLQRRGVREMAIEPALDELWWALARRETHVVVADLDWERYVRLFGSARRYATLGDLPEVASPFAEDRGADRRDPDRGAFLSSLGETPALERERLALELVRAEAALVLGHASVEAVHPQRAFRELGFDSLSGVELRNRLAAETGVRLPSTLVFDHPTPVALARHLVGQLAGVSSPPSSARIAAPASQEPIAIVGMGCRFPGGVDSPEGLWELLSAGGDGITPFPGDRGWEIERIYDPDPEHPGTIYTREGGFLLDATRFDAAFFGIGPREALAMGPQQRLLLEVCWEALEKAGVDPHSLRGSETGVFMGESFSDYGPGLFGSSPNEVKPYLGSGNAASVMTGRVAYTLGLEGPAMTVNTACSSSLVALHLAAASLRAGECLLALVGGVTVMSTPGVFLDFAHQRGSAPDGRCKSFAERADGAGWGEGVGVLALERLSDAERHGRDVLALVRGSAINQDGASNGLTAPSGPAQQRVIARALANAGIEASEVDAVEAHGTGTRLGDPIEAQALMAAYGQGREGDPLWLGSIKSNIGHTQAAAGVAGVIKMVLALRHERLPRTLHAQEPSSRIDWTAGAVSLLSEEVPWRRNGRPRRAGVSSFGISGTNSHVIVEEPPPRESPSPASTGEEPNAREELAEVDREELSAPLAWALSARSRAALRAQARALREHLDGEPDARGADVALSLAARAQLEYRAVALGEDRDSLLAGVRALAEDRASPRLLVGGSAATARPLAFLLTGQGAQRAGMGAELSRAHPAFARALDELCELLDEQLERPLRDVLHAAPGSAEAARLDDTAFAQPALFAFEVAMFRLLESWGVRPAYLIGHSVGELAAAHLAGVLSLPDACRLVAARGRLMAELPRGGAMLAVQGSEQELRESLADHDGAVSIAAVNGPASVVLSGDREAVLELGEMWRGRGRKTSRLRVSHAFHSALMEPMLDRFAELAAELSYATPTIPLVSNLTGELAGEELCQPGYWVRHVREPVRFAAGVRCLLSRGVGCFLELGPDAALGAMVDECVSELLARAPAGIDSPADRAALGGEDERPAPVVAAVARAGRPETTTLLAALASVWSGGAEVGWRRVLGGEGARRIPLPTYAFQRERYWLDSVERGGAGDATAIGQDASEHPLLGAAIALAGEKGFLFTGRLSLREHPWLADHVVLGQTLLPGAALLELALHAGGRLGVPVVEELTLHRPLALPAQGAVQLQLCVGEPRPDGARPLSLYSRREPDPRELPEQDWTCHASGALAAASGAGPSERRPGAWPPAGAEPVALDGLYERLLEHGLDYGPAFQGLTRAWRLEGELLAEASLPPQELERAGAFAPHPALLDAALHATALAAAAPSAEGGPRLPFSWSDVRLQASGETAVRARFRPGEGDSLRIELAAADGRPLGSVGSLVARPATIGAGAGGPDGRFGLRWLPLASAAEPPGIRRARLARVGLEADVEAAPTGLGAGTAGGAIDLGEPLASHADLAGLRGAMDRGEAGPVELVLLDCTAFAGDRDLPARAHLAVVRVLDALQQWLADERLNDARLAVLTRGAVAVGPGEQVEQLAASAVWGLVRSAQAEHPGRFLLIDLDGGERSSDELARALACGEPELAIRNGEPLVARLARSAPGQALAPPAGERAWRLDGDGSGTLDGLALVACPDRMAPLKAGEVRVQVRAAGVNFKDVLIALGVYPGAAEIGNEAAGVVLDVGAGVGDLAPGDRVCGLFAGAFGPLAVADARLLARIPDSWSFAQAASVPLVFLTAYYALVDLAELRSGERLLLHAATGGVGTAALQLARRLGAEVFATAGERKRALLERAGVPAERIGCSRDPGFAERFLRETGGAGVDVVLNSLTGELIDASLCLLPRGGRFLEMGKTDLRDAKALAREHNGVSYTAFDLMDAGPERIREMLLALMGMFERGELEPPPLRAWDVRHAPAALRFMSQARHVGKIALTMPAEGPRAGGTTLITGGTGGLGGMVARSLVGTHGVRHLLLASRAGEAAPGVAALRQDLESAGAEVRIVSCDVAEREQVRRLLESVAPEQPLRAVIHAAGALDDGLIGSLDAERVARALSAKLDGAWHLHELSTGMDLDSFVLFSSVSGTLGAPGQGNYAAANAFLDALAAYRRARGLPAVSMSWGPWEQTSGMTATLKAADLARMAGAGMRALPAERALELFDGALDCDGPLAVLADLDLRALAARAAREELPAVLSGLVRAAPRSRPTTSPASGSLAERVAVAPAADRGRIVRELVREQTAAVLGYASPQAVDPSRTFKDLGFDSLAAVDLRNRLGAATGLRLPATLVFDHPTLAALAGALLGQLAGGAGAREQDEPDLQELARGLSQLSAEQARRSGIATRLRETLANWESASDRAEQAPPERDGDLADAADEELFELIDREFGVL